MGSYELEEGEIVEEYGSDVFLDVRVRCVLGDVMKDFEGVVFKQKLRPMYGQWGTFFPTNIGERLSFFTPSNFSSPPPSSSTNNNMGLQPKKRKEACPAQVFEDSVKKKTSLASQVNNTRKKMKVATTIEQKDQQPSQVNVDGAAHGVDERVKMVFGNFKKGFEGGRLLCKETLGPLYGQYGSFLPTCRAGSSD